MQNQKCGLDQNWKQVRDVQDAARELKALLEKSMEMVDTLAYMEGSAAGHKTAEILRGRKEAAMQFAEGMQAFADGCAHALQQISEIDEDMTALLRTRS